MSGDDVTPPRPAGDRRTFLKRMTGDAIDAAEMLVRSRGVPGRSAGAAFDAAAAELGISPTPERAPSIAGSAPGAAPAATPRPRPAESRLRALTDDERRLLSAATVAVVAVVVRDGPPHLSRAPFHWDGEVARLLGTLFGARVSHIERDGRLSLLVEDPSGWLTLAGEARVVSGSVALEEARELLAHLYADEPAETAWARLTRDGEQAVTIVRPSRIVSQIG